MGNSDGEKLYRVKTKKRAHLNEKVKEDGSKAAIQFDEENGLQGPVDLIEVDESEYTKEIIVEVERKERSIGNVVLEDVFVPAVTEALTVLMERAMDAGIDVLSTKVIPAIKVKGAELLEKAKSSHIERKRKSSKYPKQNTMRCALQKETLKQQPVHHSQEEVDQIINNMRLAALYIAAGIRELSNTVVTESGTPERALEMETKLKELSSEQVMNTINFMLEENNRDKLDQATLQLFEAFRNRELIVDGEAIPISTYLVDDGSKATPLSE